MSEDDKVRGWAAAAAVAKRSATGLRKLVAAGRLAPVKDGDTYVFKSGDLLALRPEGAQITPTQDDREQVPAANDVVVTVAMNDASEAAGPPPAEHTLSDPAGPAGPAAATSPQQHLDERLAALEVGLDAEIVARRNLEEQVALERAAVQSALGRVSQAFGELRARLAATEQRVRTDVTPLVTAGLDQRLGAVEQRLAAAESIVRGLPMSPAVLDGRKCPRCHQRHVFALAGCRNCGHGLGPPA